VLQILWNCGDTGYARYGDTLLNPLLSEDPSEALLRWFSASAVSAFISAAIEMTTSVGVT
jgi:hypothetical protein